MQVFVVLFSHDAWYFIPEWVFSSQELAEAAIRQDVPERNSTRECYQIEVFELDSTAEKSW